MSKEAPRYIQNAKKDSVLMAKRFFAVILLALLTIVMGSCGGGESSKEVSFSDSYLERCIRETIGKPTGPLTQSDVQGIYYLTCNGPPHNIGIESLTGMHWLTGLQELWLSNNQISDITPLRGLTGLQTLRLDINQISDITPLGGL